MRWSAPPDRREITLVLFSLTVFILSYNLDVSLRILGLDPVATQGAVLNKIGLGKSAIDKDGRKPYGWRDRLESEIFGEWGWDEGHIAGDGAERSQAKGADRYGALWLSRAQAGTVASRSSRDGSAANAIEWQGESPVTTILKHVPGYTVLDNLVMANGTVYIVTDESGLPPIESIVSTKSDAHISPWKIISRNQARQILPHNMGRIPGVTWISADHYTHNSTLLALWRTYSALDPSIDSTGKTTLAPPLRLFFPHIPTFSDPPPSSRDDMRRRVRSDTGFSPYLAKAAFPTLGLLYEEDWQDYNLMGTPFIFDRVVVACRGSAKQSLDLSQPDFSPVFDDAALSTSQYWWEPVRRSVANYFNTYQDPSISRQKSKKPLITYLHRQNEIEPGPRLENDNHVALVNALEEMAKSYHYDLSIISSVEAETSWNHKLGSLSRSTVTIGVHGTNLLDSVYMKPSPQTALMEFFPVGMFTREREIPIRSLGMQYTAWWNDKSYEGKLLPAVVLPDNQEVLVDVPAVIKAIVGTLSKS